MCLGYTFGENIGGTVSPPRGDPQKTKVSHGVVGLTLRWAAVDGGFNQPNSTEIPSNRTSVPTAPYISKRRKSASHHAVGIR